MKHTEAKLNDIKTREIGLNMLDRIERDYRNYYGGITRWNSGLETHLTDSAKKKIDMINARLDRLFREED